MRLLLAQSEGDDVIANEVDNIMRQAPTSFGDAVDVVAQKLTDLWTGFLLSLPILMIGLAVLIITTTIAKVAASALRRALEQTKIDPVVARLFYRVVRSILMMVAVLFSLSVIGVSVANVVTLLAVLGFAIGLAVQGILQNFVSGVILLIRKPFSAGDAIITGDFEGVVDDIDFRVTRLVAYDGTIIRVPNGDVFDTPLINLTQEGRRRSQISIGVDYRDDQDEARRVLTEAVAQVEGVMEDPPSDVLLTELGDSSVNFVVRFWTKPDIKSVVTTTDRVLSASKHAVEDAGMSIPWPIRTLVMDAPVEIERQG